MKNDPASYSQFRNEMIKAKGLSSDFCLVPFTTLNLHPDGTVSVCRNKGTDFIVGSLKENSLNEIWNGPKLKAWREEFLSGKIETCKWEIQNLSCQNCHWVNSLWDKAEITVEPKSVIRLGANFNGECNLCCRMCYVWTQESGLYDDRNYWPLMKKNLLPFLDILELFSGEPFIQEDTFRLSELLKEMNPGCRWFVTTNGHFDFSERIKNFLMNTNLGHLVFSLDTLNKDQFPSIRRGGDLTRVLENIKNVSQFYEDHPEVQKPELSFNVLVMKDNYKELPKLYEFAEASGFRVSLIILQRPPEYSILNLDLCERIKALEYLHESLGACGAGQRVLSSLLHSLPIAERKAFLFKNAVK